MSEFRRSKRKCVIGGNSGNDSNSNPKRLKQSHSKICMSAVKNSKQSTSNSSSSEDDLDCSSVISKSQTRLPSSSKRDSQPLPDFSSIEDNIFSGVSRLSDSDSDSDFQEVSNLPPTTPSIKSEATGSVDKSESSPNSSLFGLLKTEQSITVSDSKNFSLENCKKSGAGKKSKLSLKSLSNGKEHLRKRVTNGESNVKECDENTIKSDMSESTKTSSRFDKKPGQKGRCKQTSQESKKSSSVSSRRRAGSAKSLDASKTQKPPTSSSILDKGTSSDGVKKEVPEKIDNLDVSALLALGEGLNSSSKSPSPSDSEDDWEEVEGVSASEPVLPKGGVEITLKMPELFHRRKRRDQMACLQAEVNRNFNRARRELQILFHKTSLLGWIAHGVYVNNALNSDHLKALAMSLVPTELFLNSKKWFKKDIQQILKWFTKTIEGTEGFPIVSGNTSKALHVSLGQQFTRKVARSYKEQVYMFVCTLRALGIDARLVISFRPMPLKPPSGDLLPINPKTKPKMKDVETKLDSPEKKTGKRDQPSMVKSASKNSKTKTESPPAKPLKRKSCQPSLDGSEPQKSPKKTRELRARPPCKSYVMKSESEDDPDEKEPILSPDKQKSLTPSDKERLKAAAAKRMRGGKRFSPCDNSSTPSTSPKSTKKRIKASISTKDSKSSNLKPSSSSQDNQDSDSDFEPICKSASQVIAPKSSPKKRKGSHSKGKGMSVLSTDEEQSISELSNGSDYWVEIYLEDEERWVPIDITSGKVDNVKQLLARASQPICYVVAFNADSTVKDVTRRYSPKFSQVTAKLQVSANWWEKTLKPFKPKRSSKDIHEDSEMNLVELDRPLPTKIGECKNHPLYALRRHLLKFEAIYPPDAPTLGFIGNGEAIYARQNVYTLHSREMWIKEAKVVRLGEKPYKIVKARPKWDKVNCKVLTDLPLELYGSWQIEDYVPPPAVDGKVPRNAYGNVELFKPTMLPKGCVHLQVPSLNRVAKKLKIDCAPAVVGFDYHSGGCHPTYDGFVVCEEFVDVLMDAWNRDIDESAKRREEKHEKRVYGNWRRLIKGLLIREHLKHRYDFKEQPGQHEASSSYSQINVETLKSSRISEDEPPPPILFPKLMAKMRAQKRSTKIKSTPAKAQGSGKNVKGKAKQRKKKSETSEEEDVSDDWDSSSTSQDESEMILLSDEDSGDESS